MSADGLLPRVLCVDDEVAVRAALRRELAGYQVEQAGSAEEARRAVAAAAPEVIISDLRLPGDDGIVFLSWVAAAHPQVVRILLTGYGDYQASLRAINSGRVFALLEKPWSREELLETVRAGLAVQRQTGDRDALAAQFADGGAPDLTIYLPLLQGLSRLDRHQPGRAERVAAMLESFGRFLKLSEARVLELRLAGLAHALGELGLSDACHSMPLMSLQGPPAQEFKEHPRRGGAALQDVPGLTTVAATVAAQHERFDGGGFPNGLEGNAIPVAARLLAVVVAYDAARNARLRARAMSEAEAHAYLRAQAGTQFDPRAVAAFLRFLQRQAGAAKPNGTPVDQLRPGMVLEKDLATASGILLVPAGHPLTKALLARIRVLADGEPVPLLAEVRSG